MASQLMHSRGSTKPLISGSPSVIESLDTWLDEFPDRLEDALDSVLTSARDDLRKAARRSADWAPFADMLDVEMDAAGDIVYVIKSDPATTQRIMELEYGGDGTVPQSVLRTSANRQAPILAFQMGKEITRGMPRA